MAQQIFISYSRVDSENTDKLIRRLKRTFPDFIIWHDSHLSSRGGQKWWDNILDGIEGADIFLYLLSNESLASPYCQAEFAEAQRLERPFIAVQLRDRTEIPDTLADYQYIDLANPKGEDDPYDDLVASIYRLLPESARAKSKKFPKKNRTPKPGTSETTDAVNRTDVVTPPLVIPDIQHQGGGVTAQYIIAAIGAIAVIIAAIITILPAILSRMDDAKATQTAEALTQNFLQTPTALSNPTTDPVDATLTAIFAEMAVAGAGTATVLAETQTFLDDMQATSHAVETTVGIETQVAERIAIEIARTPTVSNTLQLSPTTPTNTLSMTPTIPTNIPEPTLDSLEAALRLASIRVTSNAQWQSVYPGGFVREFHGVEMVLIPAGCFVMGSTNQQLDYAVSLGGLREWFTNEQPVSEVCFDTPFWIDRYEVSNTQFVEFNGVAANPSNWATPNLPREKIMWYEARDFCRLRDTRLPTEAEWEYAAQGPDNLIFPWGNEFVAENVVYYENSGDRTFYVGSRPTGSSWVGALDMSGNVWEWTSTLYHVYPYVNDGERENNRIDGLRVLRGGSFNYSLLHSRAESRNWSIPDNWNSYIGFRCARDL